MPKKIAERRELPTIAAVIPALRFLGSLNHNWLHIRWHTRAGPIPAAVAIRRGRKAWVLRASVEVSVGLE